jgi:dihydropteroate synthase
MHSRGALLDIASYEHADYEGPVVTAVVSELGAAMAHGVAAGVAMEAMVVDPGFGFAKTIEQNFQLLRELSALGALGRPVLVGPSRKRFLGAVADVPADHRDHVTGVACALAYERGARLFRVHDVTMTRQALAVTHAVYGDRS